MAKPAKAIDYAARSAFHTERTDVLLDLPLRLYEDLVPTAPTINKLDLSSPLSMSHTRQVARTRTLRDSSSVIPSLITDEGEMG